MKRSHVPALLAAALSLQAAVGCAASALPCASNADCTTSETCVLNEDGGRCQARAAPADAAPSPGNDTNDPGDQPADEPGDPPGEPGDEPGAEPEVPNPGAPHLVAHTVGASAAGAAGSASFRLTQRIASIPGRTQAGGAWEVRN